MPRLVRGIHPADGPASTSMIRPGLSVDPPDKPGDDGGESETKTKPAPFGAPVFF